MRIALLIDSLGSGGAQRQFVGLASILKKEGFEVKVFCYFDLPFMQMSWNAIILFMR